MKQDPLDPFALGYCWADARLGSWASMVKTAGWTRTAVLGSSLAGFIAVGTFIETRCARLTYAVAGLLSWYVLATQWLKPMPGPEDETTGFEATSES